MLIAADYIYLPKEIRRTTDFLTCAFWAATDSLPRRPNEVLDKTADLQRWREQVAAHAAAAPVAYAFFNDDYAGHAPTTANRFKALLGLTLSPARLSKDDFSNGWPYKSLPPISRWRRSFKNRYQTFSLQVHIGHRTADLCCPTPWPRSGRRDGC